MEYLLKVTKATPKINKTMFLKFLTIIDLLTIQSNLVVLQTCHDFVKRFDIKGSSIPYMQILLVKFIKV